MSIHTPADFDIDNLYLSDPLPESIDKGKQKINYFRMKMWDTKEDNRLHIQPHKMFCFGVQEAKSMEDDTKITGYDCTFALISQPNPHVVVRTDDEGIVIQPTWEELGANPQELVFLNLMEAMHKKIAKRLFEVRAKCGLAKIKRPEDMLDKLSPPWHFARDKETKMPDYTKSPTLKAKLIVGMKNGMKMYSRFYDANDDKLDVNDYIGERFNAIPALAFESIYIGDAYVTFQIKLPEAVIFPAESGGNRRLLKHVTSNIGKLNITDEDDTVQVKETKTETENTQIIKPISVSKSKVETVNTDDTDEKPLKSPIKKTVVKKSSSASVQKNINALLGDQQE